jgi:hypothetical protein
MIEDERLFQEAIAPYTPTFTNIHAQIRSELTKHYFVVNPVGILNISMICSCGNITYCCYKLFMYIVIGKQVQIWPDIFKQVFFAF